jgi:hypothetical protein
MVYNWRRLQSASGRLPLAAFEVQYHLDAISRQFAASVLESFELCGPYAHIMQGNPWVSRA